MFLALPADRSVSRVSIVNRFVAKVIDMLLVFAVAVILPYPLGPLVGFAYSLFGDGIHWGKFHGQSVGKKIMHLQVISSVHRRPATYRDSVFRNAPVGIATFFAIIPVWGWVILALIGLPLLCMEIYLMLTVENGHRLGDVMGDTEVVEMK